MPRPFLAHEQALLQGAAYQDHTELWVEGPDGAFVNLTALAGKKWLVGFEYSTGIDQPVASIRAELWREDAAGSVAPLMGGSPLNRDALGNYARLLDVGREFYIRNAITAKGAVPTSGQWWEVVRGQVDEIPHGGRQSRITLVGRDLGGVLLETKTEEELTFGVDGQAIETALQLFLARLAPGVALYVPVASGKTIPKLTVAKDRPVLEVLREVAQGIAWDVRYLWDTGTNSFRLTFYQPQRDKVIPDLTIGPGLYKDVRDLTITRRLIRNSFSVTYTDAATGERVTRTHTNPASIDDYGRLWMAFEEAEGSPIDTAAEADAFMAAADSDLSEPLAYHEVEMLYFPHIELGDLIEFQPNGVHYDSAQKFAVVGVRLRRYPKERRTWVQTRGRPAGAHKEWFRRAVSGESPPRSPTYGTIINLRPTRRTPTTVTHEWEWDASVIAIKLQTALVPQPATEDKWPNELDPAYTALITDRSVTSYTHNVPPPGYELLAQYVPILADGTAGEKRRAPVQPTGTEPDVINSAVVLITSEDGSAEIRFEVSERTGSIRYATAVGAAPAWPSNAAVEAGTVRVPVNGVVTVSLPAGTVPYNQSLRVRAAPYVNVNGTGTDGAADHGEIKNAERARLKPPVSLEITRENKTSTQGTLGVTVRDPGGYSTGGGGGLYVRTQTGEAALTAWALVAASPVNGTEYTQAVALIEGHPSYVEFRLGYSINGQTGYVYANSAGFDKGAYPNISIVPRINEDTGAASAAVIGDADTFSVKIAASTAGYPTEATVRAASAISGRMLTPALVGTLLTATLGQTIFFSAFAYGPNGEESTALAKAEAQFKIIAPVLEVSGESESGTSADFQVTVRDPAGQADALYYRTKSGSGALGAWTLKSATPGNGVAYTESVSLMEDHLSFIEFRLDSTIAGQFIPHHLKSSGFDKGKVPDPAFVPRIDANGNVTVEVQGDFDTASTKIAASTSGYPSSTTVRAAAAINGRVATSGTLVTLQMGQTAFISAYGYSATGGGGTESSALFTASITRVASFKPTVAAELSRTGTSATLTLTISDPFLKVTSIEFDKREPDATGSYISSGWVTSWDSSTGTIGSSADLIRQEAVSVSDGRDAQIRWRVYFTDENGVSKQLGDTVPVSTLQGLTKTIRIPFSSFVPVSHTYAWSYNLDYVTPSGVTSSQRFIASVVLPDGVTLTNVSADTYRASTSDQATLAVYRLNSDRTATQLGLTVSHSTTGWQTLSTTHTETISSKAITVNLTLRNNAATGDSRLAWVDVTYTAPTYAKTL